MLAGGGVDPNELSEFDSVSTLIFRASGASLFELGEFDAVFKIISGLAMIYYLFADGRRHVVRFVLPGEFFGLSAGKRHQYFSQAIGPTEARLVSWTQLNSEPGPSRWLSYMVRRELETAYSLMTGLGRMSAHERVAMFLLDFRRRWRVAYGPVEHVPLPMGRKEIADHLGLTIETVSRTLTQLCGEGILEAFPRRVVILDEDRLAAIPPKG